jgi:hypothetical protein
MNSRFKIKYFEDKWTGSESNFLRTAKPKVKKFWDDIYKCENVIIRSQLSPLRALSVNYLENILSQIASQLAVPTRISLRKD